MVDLVANQTYVLKQSDTVMIHGVELVASHTSNYISEPHSHFLDNRTGDNAEALTRIGIKDKYKWATDLFGDRVHDSGVFPFCDSWETLTEMARAIQQWDLECQPPSAEQYTRY